MQVEGILAKLDKMFVEHLKKQGVIVHKGNEPRSYDIRLRNGSIIHQNWKTLRSAA